MQRFETEQKPLFNFAAFFRFFFKCSGFYFLPNSRCIKKIQRFPKMQRYAAFPLKMKRFSRCSVLPNGPLLWQIRYKKYCTQVLQKYTCLLQLTLHTAYNFWMAKKLYWNILINNILKFDQSIYLGILFLFPH